MADVTRDSAGNLYGTTDLGGTAGAGVVYKLDATGVETILYTFTGGSDGGNPVAGVIRDSAGNLYGTTGSGGKVGAGVVYKLDTAGRETSYSFPEGADGQIASGGVIRDSTGNFYGTASLGGTANSGVVYKLDAAGHETVLYTFTGGTDGGYPNAGVIRDSAGNLYGTTIQGGSGAGVVYMLDTSGHETVVYSFTGGADGGRPFAGVIRDSAGNLYGTTYQGGTANAGVVYELDVTGHETVLYTFTGGADGGNPFAGVIRDSAGNLYGTTYQGGPANAGVVYKLDSTGHETVVHSFTVADGSTPYAGVIRDSAGNLYGTTSWGGTADVARGGTAPPSARPLHYPVPPAGNCETAAACVWDKWRSGRRFLTRKQQLPGTP
ncbi:MAG: choice-of-anchor tandem repeat GloVer-containing protein [Bryobacteraceae bacterium]